MLTQYRPDGPFPWIAAIIINRLFKRIIKLSVHHHNNWHYVNLIFSRQLLKQSANSSTDLRNHNRIFMKKKKKQHTHDNMFTAQWYVNHFRMWYAPVYDQHHTASSNYCYAMQTHSATQLLYLSILIVFIIEMNSRIEFICCTTPAAAQCC